MAGGKLGVCALAVALALAACGGDGGEGKAPSGGQPVATIDVSRATQPRSGPT